MHKRYKTPTGLPCQSATDAVKLYREPSIVLMSMQIHFHLLNILCCPSSNKMHSVVACLIILSSIQNDNSQFDSYPNYSLGKNKTMLNEI